PNNLTPRLQISLFGGLSIQYADRSRIELPPKQTSSLLAYLAMKNGRCSPREELATLLWPESEPDKANQNLRQCVHSLHLLLEQPPLTSGTFLRATRTEISLDSAAFRTDVADFERALEAAKRAESPGDRIAHLTAAVELYRGELLPGFYLDFFV